MGISREDLWRQLADAPVPVVHPMIMAAYELELHRDWCSPTDPSRGTSFPIRLFPGNDSTACGRLAVYSLLNPPEAKPLEPKVKAWFDLGVNLELDWVRRLDSYGTLLSASVAAGDDNQTRFTDEEHWLNGYVDAIVLSGRKGHCIEIKTTSHEKVLKMLASNGADVPRSHGKYLRQLGTYIGLSHEQKFSPTVWICTHSGLIARPVLADGDTLGWCCAAMTRENDRPHPLLHSGPCSFEEITVIPPDDGTLIYSSREEPLTVASFGLTYDPQFMTNGRAKLAEWKQAFIEERIPEHPHEHARAKWTVDPCQYCDLKASVCKPDYTGKIKSLRDSNLIASAQSISPTWDYDERRAAVLARWNQIETEELTTA